MVERLKHEGTSHSSSDLLKIFVKMEASWSAHDFRQAVVTPCGPGAFSLFCFWKTWHTLIYFKFSSKLLYASTFKVKSYYDTINTIVW